jgi:hypothetical protein
LKNEGNEYYTPADPIRVMISMSNKLNVLKKVLKEEIKRKLKEALTVEFKENIQKQVKSIKATQIKNLERHRNN